MNTLQYLQAAGTITTMLGMLFLAYRSIMTPQQNSQIDDAKLAEKIKNTLEQVAGVQRDLTNLRDNHVHTLDVKMDLTNKAVQDLALQMTRLNTIIEERIPRQKIIQ